VAAADHDYVIVLRHSLDSSGMNPHMRGEKDAAGRRHSLLGCARWAQVRVVDRAVHVDFSDESNGVSEAELGKDAQNRYPT
jgi:hypothetical protein